MNSGAMSVPLSGVSIAFTCVDLQKSVVELTSSYQENLCSISVRVAEVH